MMDKAPLSAKEALKLAKGGKRNPAKTRANTSADAANSSASVKTLKPLFRADTTLDALIENVQTLTGQRGDGAAVVMVTSDGSKVPFYPDGSGGNTGGGGGSGENGGDDGGKTPEYPTQPTGLQVNGGFTVVELDWDAPKYYGHSQTQIWRSPEDNLSEAVQVGSTAANIYSDPIDPVFEGYYWIRFVNADAVVGPYNDSRGTYVITQESTQDIIDVINDEINNSPLIDELQAGLDGVEEEVTTIDSEGTQAFQNMWSVKASADGITAGIGLVAGIDGDGNPISQVAVAASQFFVFDPNNPNPDGSMESLFYVDAEHGVCIQKAVIEQATIDVLNAQTIVADEVTAGIEIDSPDIKGGQIEIGNGFTVDSSGNMTAKNAVLNDAELNQVTANGGQFDNVTISENCVIEGTLSANQIKGDIVNAAGDLLNIGDTRTITITDDQDFDRSVIINPIVITCQSKWNASDQDWGTAGGTLTITANNTEVASVSVSADNGGSAANSASYVGDLLTGHGNMVIKISTTGNHADVSSFSVLVAKKGSGGIIIS